MGFKDFWNSDEGRVARYNGRKRKRMFIWMHNIEPQSKKMSVKERARFQTEVAEQLASTRRSTFSGDIALKLAMATTERNAPQAHTIAKNFLDLLSQRQVGVNWPRRHLLYKDDSQIQGLSVSCRHGQARPEISIEARPFAAMLDDLELAIEATRRFEMESHAQYDDDRESEWIESFASALRDGTNMRARLGDDTFEAYVKMTRFYAQKALLSRSRVALPVLAWMYGRPKSSGRFLSKETWAQMTTESRLRLQIGSLPLASGGSAAFKASIDVEIAAFKKRWDWIISPLVLPVGLEVIVRLDAKTPPGVLHDLDNIVRDYLIPKIVPSFGTVTDYRWTIDSKVLQGDPKFAASWGPMPPAGTKSGVTRYEVWRLPPVKGEPGFVSVAIVGDADVDGDKMEMADRTIEKWSETLQRKRRW